MIEWVEWPETASAEAWDTALVALPDHTIFQAHAWGEYKRRRGWSVRRGQVAIDGRPGGMAQCLVREIRIARVAIVWVPGGPAGGAASRIHLGAALRRRYRGWLLCLRANFMAERQPGDDGRLVEAGWAPARVRVGHPVTFHLDLRTDLEARRAALHGNWRHNLRRGERRDILVKPWPATDPLEAVHAIYREMSGLKGVAPTMSLGDLEALRGELGPSFTLAAALDRDGTVVAVRGFAGVGARAHDMIAAVSRVGRALYATYPLTWRLLELARSQGAGLYDLGGADLVGAPGVYNFKKGLGGREVEMIGEWEWATSRLLRWGVNRAALGRDLRVAPTTT